MNGKSQGTLKNVFLNLSNIFIYFRFDVEICTSLLANYKEVLEKISGKFGIFCCPSVRINEEIIKAAGKIYHITVSFTALFNVKSIYLFFRPKFKSYWDYVCWL